MKTTAGCLIALTIFLLLSLTGEVALSIAWAIRHGTFNFNWPDALTIAGWYAPCILLLALAIVMWRHKPKNWLW
jgi:hypothetical protein